MGTSFPFLKTPSAWRVSHGQRQRHCAANPRSFFSFSGSKGDGAAALGLPKHHGAFTASELSQCNGTDHKPIYIALRSDIYDVSESAELYGPEGTQPLLAGRDISRAAAKGSLEDEEELNNLELSDLTEEQQQRLDAMIEMFEVERNYPKVGRLVISVDELPRDQLVKFNGVDNPRRAVYVSVSGVVYDVTSNGLNHYGPDGTYALFAGHDATRALACMSLDPGCLDCPCLGDLTEEQLGALNDWVVRFQHKYAVVGKLGPWV
jgi:membrane-associated progesterone receptor component